MATWALFKQLFASKSARHIVIALLIATIFLTGIQLRRWIGDTTRHVRYQHDIVNGFYWGSEVLKEARRSSPDERSANSWTGFCRGYFALYDASKIKRTNKNTVSITPRYDSWQWQFGPKKSAMDSRG
jgi:hypothetical protein